jgi:DNA invertase Pin-like site-specific DNA recombinase
MDIGYGRVSTLDQNPDLQRDALQAAGVEPRRIYVVTASGALAKRPGLDRALEQLRPGDTLVVWRLDRLGRSLRHLIDTVAGLAEQGIGFKSLTEGIDTTTASGKLVFHVFGALAEFERDLIRERTAAGLESARRRGRKGGRPRKMSPAKLRHARELADAGQLSMDEIAELVGVHRTTLYRHLAGGRQGTSRDPQPGQRVFTPPAPEAGDVYPYREWQEDYDETD